MQVELAQLEYNMARMRGLWTHLERLGAGRGVGGIGTRGPGESQIETDRRLARDRITVMKRRLEHVKETRATQRAERFRASLLEHPIAADGIVLNVTASIGIAEFDGGLHQDDDAFYHAADSAVYRAKAAGRNRVCCDEPALASMSEEI
jgi:GTP-binding protein HflX